MEQCFNVAGAVQNPDNVGAIFKRKIKNQITADRKTPQILGQFIAAFPLSPEIRQSGGIFLGWNP